MTDAIVGFHAQPSLAEIDRLTPFGVRLRYGELDEMVPVGRGLALGWAELSIAWARDVLDADQT